MLELAAVPPGPYALFHHNTHVFERMNDIKTVVMRLLENRELLTDLNRAEAILRQKADVVEELGTNYTRRQNIHQQVKLDMESLFIFGNLLDQWAYVIGYLVGNEQPEGFNFIYMVNQLQKRGIREHYTPCEMPITAVFYGCCIKLGTIGIYL